MKRSNEDVRYLRLKKKFEFPYYTIHKGAKGENSKIRKGIFGRRKRRRGKKSSPEEEGAENIGVIE